MKRLTPGKKIERRGRPRTGRTPLVTIRLPHATIAAVDRWAKRNRSRSRSQAIRDLIEGALSIKRRR